MYFVSDAVKLDSLSSMGLAFVKRNAKLKYYSMYYAQKT
jgi:hypothetical protein